MIGNSLTQDSQPVPGTLAAYAADRQRFISVGYQIRLGQSLISLKNTPGSSDFLQGGQWNQALPARARNCLTMQPYDDGVSTMDDDVTAMSAFIDAFTVASPTGKCFLYEVWPPYSTDGAYQPYWTAAVTDSLATLTTQRRAYFNALYARMLALYPDRIYLIPAGEVYFKVDIAAKAGQITGLSTIQGAYRDSLHGGGIGRFMTAATVLACVFRMKPQASPETVAIFAALSGVGTLTEAMAAQLETIVWDTVRADARTGV